MIDTDLIYKAMTNRHHGLWPSIDDVKKMNEMETYCICDIEATKMLSKIMNKRIEEIKMKNIKWHVDNVTVDNTCGTITPFVKVNIMGCPTKPMTMNEYGKLSDHIERCLNRETDVQPAPWYPTNTTYHPDRIIPEIKDVIFNGPATIVLWKDGTKTVVKAQEGETIDREKGLAMAISKRMLGNNYDYYKTFKKYLRRKSDGNKR